MVEVNIFFKRKFNQLLTETKTVTVLIFYSERNTVFDTYFFLERTSNIYLTIMLHINACDV